MAQANGNVKDALKYLDQHFDDFKATLVELSRIPSVSADGFPPEEVRRSARGHRRRACARSGIENVQVLEIPGVHPYVYGDWLQEARRAHHPALRPPRRAAARAARRSGSRPPSSRPSASGRLYGRGTADDKAGVMAHVAAVACLPAVAPASSPAT